MNVNKTVTGFATVAFTLLGVLFGMVIMTFIFGQLGPSAGGLVSGDAGYEQAVAIQNNSLNSIETYSEQSDTQFLTVAISITLAVLIGLFLVFWGIFVGGKKSGGMSGGNFS